jgi:hypothetical protein
MLLYRDLPILQTGPDWRKDLRDTEAVPADGPAIGCVVTLACLCANSPFGPDFTPPYFPLLSDSFGNISVYLSRSEWQYNTSSGRSTSKFEDQRLLYQRIGERAYPQKHRHQHNYFRSAMRSCGRRTVRGAEDARAVSLVRAEVQKQALRQLINSLIPRVTVDVATV